MKMIMNVILVVLAFAWISGASADKGSKHKGLDKQSPESSVTCSNNGTTHPSLPEAINTEYCVPWGSPCATCIISLENQGCKIIDVNATNFLVQSSEGHIVDAGVTYLLSCVKP